MWTNFPFSFVATVTLRISCVKLQGKSLFNADFNGPRWKNRAEFAPFASPDLLYLLNPLAQKSWLKNHRQLAKRVPADEVYPVHHSSVKKLTASQQELERQLPEAASSKQCCNVSTATFSQGLPPEGSRSRTDSHLTRETKKSVSSFPSMTSLPVRTATTPCRQPAGHPLLLFTGRKDGGVWPSWPLLKIMLSQLKRFLSTSAGGRKQSTCLSWNRGC